MRPIGKTKTILSMIFGCIAMALFLLCIILLTVMFIKPYAATGAVYDSSLAEWDRVFNAIATGAVGILETLLMLSSIFIAYVGGFISMGFGIPALILSFNPYRSKLKVFGRLFGIVGVLYGIAVIGFTIFMSTR